MKKTLLLFFFLVSSTLFATDVNCVQEWFSDLPTTGVLGETEKGFLYLKVDEEYVERFLEKMGDPALQKPPYYGPKMVGSHISVMMPEERTMVQGPISEVGNVYSFTPLAMGSIAVQDWEETDCVYFIVVEAKDLEELRVKYGLSSLCRGYPFHITVAIHSLSYVK